MPLPSLLAGQQWAQRLHRKDAGVPYGIALAAAALVVYPDTHLDDGRSRMRSRAPARRDIVVGVHGAIAYASLARLKHCVPDARIRHATTNY